MTRDCMICKNSYLKDFAYLICSINGILDLKDVEKSKNCKDYEEDKIKIISENLEGKLY